MNCGRCVRVKCSCDQENPQHAQDGKPCQPDGKETIVMVVDSCPSCPYVGDIDLSYSAWDAVTGNESPSKYDGTWEFVECPSAFLTGPLKLRFKDGSSQWWYALQPVNHRTKITGMTVSFNGKTEDLIFGEIEGYWWKGVSQLSFPVTITMTNEEGNTASVTLESDAEISGNNEITLDGDL